MTSDDEVRRVVARARKAQAAWAVLPIEERASRLMRFRDAIVEHVEDLVEVVSRECGKPRHEALLLEVMVLLDLLGWACKAAPKALAPERTPLHLMKHRAGEVRFVPRGVRRRHVPVELPARHSHGRAWSKRSSLATRAS